MNADYHPDSIQEAHRLIRTLRQELDTIKERLAAVERLPQLSDSLEFGKLFRSEMRDLLQQDRDSSSDPDPEVNDCPIKPAQPIIHYTFHCCECGTNVLPQEVRCTRCDFINSSAADT